MIKVLIALIAFAGLFTGCFQKESSSHTIDTAGALTVNNSSVPKKPDYMMDGVGPDTWLKKEMRILVNSDATGVLSISATGILIPKQPADNALVIYYNGIELQSCEFVAGIKKKCEVDLSRLAKKPNSGWHELRVYSRRQFAPREYGINSDPRALSFQVDKIAVEQKPLFVTEGVGPDRWLLKEMKIKVAADQNGILTISAITPILKDQPADNALNVYYEGKLIKQCEIAAGSTGKCEVPLDQPPSLHAGNNWRTFRVTSKRQFVPKDLNINNDTRPLSYQIESISVNKKSMFMVDGLEQDRWLLKHIKIMVNAEARGVLSISAVGVVVPNQPNDNSLVLYNGGKPIATCDFIAGIEKSCDLNLSLLTGSPDANGWHEIQVVAKRQFVPKDLGLNDETRGLSFHIDRVLIHSEIPAN